MRTGISFKLIGVVASLVSLGVGLCEGSAMAGPDASSESEKSFSKSGGKFGLFQAANQFLTLRDFMQYGKLGKTMASTTAELGAGGAFKFYAKKYTQDSIAPIKQAFQDGKEFTTLIKQVPVTPVPTSTVEGSPKAENVTKSMKEIGRNLLRNNTCRSVPVKVGLLGSVALWTVGRTVWHALELEDQVRSTRKSAVGVLDQVVKTSFSKNFGAYDPHTDLPMDPQGTTLAEDEEGKSSVPPKCSANDPSCEKNSYEQLKEAQGIAKDLDRTCKLGGSIGKDVMGLGKSICLGALAGIRRDLPKAKVHYEEGVKHAENLAKFTKTMGKLGGVASKASDSTFSDRVVEMSNSFDSSHDLLSKEVFTGESCNSSSGVESLPDQTAKSSDRIHEAENKFVAITSSKANANARAAAMSEAFSLENGSI